MRQDIKGSDKNQIQPPVSHWTDDELLDHLYGIGPSGPDRERHLADCAACGERWQGFQDARRVAAAAPPLSDERLLRQRRTVYERLEAPASMWRIPRMVPAAATMAVVALAVFLNLPAPQPEALKVASTDSQFFSEIYDEVYGQEMPRTVQPIRGLFEEVQ